MFLGDFRQADLIDHAHDARVDAGRGEEAIVAGSVRLHELQMCIDQAIEILFEVLPQPGGILDCPPVFFGAVTEAGLAELPAECSSDLAATVGERRRARVVPENKAFGRYRATPCRREYIVRTAGCASLAHHHDRKITRFDLLADVDGCKDVTAGGCDMQLVHIHRSGERCPQTVGACCIHAAVVMQSCPFDEDCRRIALPVRVGCGCRIRGMDGSPGL